MMRSIVERAVASEADLQVAEDCEEADLEDAVTRCQAAVLIVAERADRTEAFYRPLFLTHPSLKVLILTQGGRNATLIGFRRVSLSDASPASLIDAIRSELRHESTPDEE